MADYRNFVSRKTMKNVWERARARKGARAKKQGSKHPRERARGKGSEQIDSRFCCQRSVKKIIPSHFILQLRLLFSWSSFAFLFLLSIPCFLPHVSTLTLSICSPEVKISKTYNIWFLFSVFRFQILKYFPLMFSLINYFLFNNFRFCFR